MLYDLKFGTFGVSKEADLYAEGIVAEGMKTRFDCIYHKERIGTIHLNVPGTHNILNSLAAILFALHIGIDFEAIARTLYEFKSAKRRFEVYPDTGNMTLLEDYAHHPTEIKATLKACRLLKPERIITVFQPHRYTRTKELAKEFGASFNLCDKLILTNIYAASQRPIDGVSVKNILDEVRKTGFKDVHIIPKKNITDYLYDTYQDGDLVAILGAGDINDVGRELKERLSNDKTS